MAQEASIKSLVPSKNKEGTSLKTDSLKSLAYSSEEPVSERAIAQIGFNKRTGTLNFIRHNGEVVEVSGFLTLGQMGEGPRGDKGPRGKKGRDGRIGRDGKKGKTGCEGPIGPTGEAGNKGLDGNDGETGVTGYMGCPGPIGLRGDTGEDGDVGNMGPVGPAGPSCIVGERGIQGIKPAETVYYGENAPDSNYFLWARPSGTALPSPIVEAEPMSGQVTDVSVRLAHVTDDSYGGNAILSLTNFEGGIGPFSYKWIDTDNSMSEAGISIDGSTTSRSLKIAALRTIQPQQSYNFSGKMELIITDKGDNNKRLSIKNIRFSFSGYNSRDNEEETEPGGPVIVGGGGCVHEDTPILMWDGSTKRAKYVKVGDTLQSFTSAGMLDEDESNWKEWKTTEFKSPKIVPTTARVAYNASYTQYWKINNDVCITQDHPVLVRKNQQWGWYDVTDVKVGDFLKGTDGVIEIKSIDHIKENLNVVVLDVEPYDNYFAGHEPIVVHNTTQTVKH